MSIFLAGIYLRRISWKLKIFEHDLQKHWNSQDHNRGLKEFETTPGCLMDTCLSAQDKYREILRCFIDQLP
jgi:hypothetical protein